MDIYIHPPFITFSVLPSSFLIFTWFCLKDPKARLLLIIILLIIIFGLHIPYPSGLFHKIYWVVGINVIAGLTDDHSPTHLHIPPIV